MSLYYNNRIHGCIGVLTAFISTSGHDLMHVAVFSGFLRTSSISNQVKSTRHFSTSQLSRGDPIRPSGCSFAVAVGQAPSKVTIRRQRQG